MDLGGQGGYEDYGGDDSSHVDVDFGAQGGFVTNGGPNNDPYQNPETAVLLSELKQEAEALTDAAQMKHAKRLLENEMERVSNDIEPEFLEVDIGKPIKVVKKVVVPVDRHPQFNFVGKILGPGGKTLQGMAKEFKCHIYILGSGSTKDKNKEIELLSSGDAQYAHFGLPLHVRIETIATPTIAYQRVTGVIETLATYLQPVRDEIVATQMAEMGHEFHQSDPRGRGRGGGPERGGFIPRGRGRGGPPRGAPRGAGFQPTGGVPFRGSSRGGGFSSTPFRGGGVAGGPPAYGGTPGFRGRGGGRGGFGGRFPTTSRGRGGQPERFNPY